MMCLCGQQLLADKVCEALSARFLKADNACPEVGGLLKQEALETICLNRLGSPFRQHTYVRLGFFCECRYSLTIASMLGLCDADEMKNVTAYLERLKARPAYQATFQPDSS